MSLPNCSAGRAALQLLKTYCRLPRSQQLALVDLSARYSLIADEIRGVRLRAEGRRNFLKGLIGVGNVPCRGVRRGKAAMANHAFRSEAREALERAKALLGEADSLQGIRYAALDVRMAMEALTYSRAQAYRKQLPSSEFATWPPKKLMTVLLSLDPWAEGGIKVEIAKGAPGTPLGDEFHSLGTDNGIGLKLLSDHYNAVGNMLHSPTMAQREGKKPATAARFRKRLVEVISYLEAVLASPIFDLNTLPLHPHRPCERCGYRIREPELDAENRAEAVCPECRLTFDLVRNVKGKMVWQAKRVIMKCATLECPAELTAYKAELKPGLSLKCEACGEETIVVYGSRRPPEDAGPGPAFQVKDT